MPQDAFKVDRILLHDNDEDEAYFFEQALKSFAKPIDLICTFNFSELQAALLKSPHLIFLDINIPEKNGFECLKAIRSKPFLNNTPVIMYSSSSRAKEIQEGYKHGANLFISKPTKIANVEKALMAVFDMDWNDLQRITAKHVAQNTTLRFGL